MENSKKIKRLSDIAIVPLSPQCISHCYKIDINEYINDYSDVFDTICINISFVLSLVHTLQKLTGLNVAEIHQ